MFIGTCDCCGKTKVPVSNSFTPVNGDTTACFICQGDTEVDPYGILEEEDGNSHNPIQLAVIIWL